MPRKGLRDQLISFVEQHPETDALVRSIAGFRRAIRRMVSGRGTQARQVEGSEILYRDATARRDSTLIKAWWSPSAHDRNFGDQLTVHLLRREGLAVQRAELGEADLLCAGSVLEMVPLGWRGIVFGAGLMFEASRCDLGTANVLGLRGPLTAARCGLAADVPLFDPVLLLDPPASRGSLVGIIPHYADRRLAREVRGDLLIKTTQAVERIAEDVARCGLIHTSSLHGAIIADAFGIPRVVHSSPVVRGSGFKFRDWDAAVAQRGIARMREDARVAFRRLCGLVA